MANVGQNWECPYCGFGQVVSQERSDKASRRLEIPTAKPADCL